MQIGTTSAHRFDLYTNSSTALTIDSSQRVGIGSPSDPGSIGSRLWIDSSSDTYYTINTTGSSNLSGIHFRNSNGNGEARILNNTGGALTFYRSPGNEAARIDSSGRLLVGTSTARNNLFNTSGVGGLFNLETTGQGVEALFVRNQNNAFGAVIYLAKTRSASVGGNTIVNSGDSMGEILFGGNDGSEFVEAASILAQVDGTPGANDMPGRLVFSTCPDGSASPTERMRITNGGNVLIGCQSLPSATVEGFVATGTSSGNRTSSGSSTSAYNHWVFYNGNGIVGSISTSASATTYATSSDYRLKENVVPLTGAADRVKQLQVHRFNFIADPDTTVDGFLAHEAQAVVPECVTGTKDAVDTDGNPVYQGIDQSKLVPLLTAALQEALQKIETLEQRLTNAGIA
jgi:hypothetical protein